MFNTDYQPEYSESYSGTLHQEIAILKLLSSYCMSFSSLHIYRIKTFSYANENLQLLQLLDSEFFVHYQLLQTK